jgi:hypothetical protein
LLSALAHLELERLFVDQVKWTGWRSLLCGRGTAGALSKTTPAARAQTGDEGAVNERRASAAAQFYYQQSIK